MKWTSILAIYCLFWVLSAFVVFPFHATTAREAGMDEIPGQAKSAPAEFRAKSIALWTTIVATVSFGLYYLAYVTGWTGLN